MELSRSILSEIIQITREIEDNYPELKKYLDERPITLPDENDPNARVDDKVLSEYLKGLKEMVSKYKQEH